MRNVDDRAGTDSGFGEDDGFWASPLASQGGSLELGHPAENVIGGTDP